MHVAGYKVWQSLQSPESGVKDAQLNYLIPLGKNVSRPWWSPIFTNFSFVVQTTLRLLFALLLIQVRSELIFFIPAISCYADKRGDALASKLVFKVRWPSDLVMSTA